MCQPKPGPRCSNHARIALEKAQKSAEEWKNSPRDFNDAEVQRIKKIQDKHYIALRAYDSTAEGQKALEDQLWELRQEKDENYQKQVEVRRESDEKLSVIKPNASLAEQELHALRSNKYVSLSRRSLYLDSMSTELEQRQRDGVERREFEMKALKFEKERLGRMDRMEDLADAGDMKGMREAFNDYKQSGFMSVPASYKAQLSKAPQTGYTIDEETNEQIRQDVYTMETANKGVVKVTVQDRMMNGGTVERSTTTTVVRPGLPSRRNGTREQMGEGEFTKTYHLDDTITAAEQRDAHITLGVRSVGKQENSEYIRKLFHKCRDNAEGKAKR